MRKLYYADHFELVAMRHREFRRAPDPGAGVLEGVEGLINCAAGRFLAMNRDLCALHGYEHGDLKTYALVWAINFLGLYAEGLNGDARAKLLFAYVKQRFIEFRTLLVKKGRSCFPTVEAAELNSPAPL